MVERDKRALVVLSGGQDSTTCLYMACERFAEVHAITFDYNQRHAIEIDAARTVAQMAGVASHEVVALGPLLKGRSFLTDLSAPVQQFATFDSMDRAATEREDKLDSSFVPMRNPLFLTLAANRASVLGCTVLYTGITAADFAEYGGFSWPWLGGFVDAEGHFSQPNPTGWRLSISQKDPELLYRIGTWLQQQVPGLTFGLSHKNGVGELTIGKIHGEPVMQHLSPHLHSPHRRNQGARLGAQILDEAPLTDAYVTGFWEGDGACGGREVPTRCGAGMTRQFQFSMFQKDPEVLELIAEYLGTGTVYQRNTQNHIWCYVLSDGPQSAKFLRRMRPYMNVLGSFSKVSRARHKLGLTAGGFNPPYPDCSPDFLYEFQSVIDESLRTPFTERVVVEAPLLYLTKAQSVWLAQSLPGAMEALAYSHTCYSGVYPPCGTCHACLLRAHGFEVAGTPDPLVQRSATL